MKNTVKVIGFNNVVVEKYIEEAREVENLKKEYYRPRIFGWISPTVIKKLKKAHKWVSNGWYHTPQMRTWLENGMSK